MKSLLMYALVFSLCAFTTINAQYIASKADIMNAFNGSNVLITQIDGNITQTSNVNYCENGLFTMAITKTEVSQMGGETKTSWNVQGLWKLHEQNGYNCIHYTYQDTPMPYIEPIYKNDSGGLYIQGKSLELLGTAKCAF